MTILIDEETGEVTGLTIQDRAKQILNIRDEVLIELAARSKDLTHEIKSEQDYKEIGRAKSALVSMRITINTGGKAGRDDMTATAKAIINEEKRCIAIFAPEEARLQALQDAWTDKKKLEAGRAAAEIEAKFQAIKSVEASLDHGLNFGDNSMTIMARIDAVTGVDVNALDGSRKVEFELKKLTTLNTLNAAFDVASANEAAQASVAAVWAANDAAAAQRIAEQNEATERTQKLANAPDADKLIAYRDALMALKPPAMETVAGMELMTSILTALTKLADRIEDAARSM